MTTTTLSWQSDPRGEYPTEIVTCIEEEKTGDWGEVDVCPDIIRIVTKGELLK